MLVGWFNGPSVSTLGTRYFPLLVSVIVIAYEVPEWRDWVLTIFKAHTIKHNTFYTVSPEYVQQLNQ